MVKLSIIIPTLNEEKYLEHLLKSIEKQYFEDYEIIISDSKSKDNTIKVAKRYGAKIVIGEKKGPGHGRNLGAEKAKGKYLLFIDADVILQENNTLSNVIDILGIENVSGGTALFKCFDGNKREKKWVNISSKIFEFLIKLKISVALGFFMFTRKELFEKVGGFDEELPFCEDHKLVKKLKNFGKMKVIDSKILISSRRLRNMGFFKTLKIYIFSTIAYIISEDYLKKKFKFDSSTTIENNKIK